jgi:two-component system alkaline phosphatase synthesis response regulator PhoP
MEKSHPNTWSESHISQPSKRRILLVEDEEALRVALGDRLQREGYVVDFASDGDAGFVKATSQPFELLILDVMLPSRSGFDLCRDIRAAGLKTPILLLTARGETVDKVVGLKVGADDYVSKPFDMRELMARIEALLRRVPAGESKGVHHYGLIRVDVAAMTVTRQGIPVHLSAREFQLLVYFMEHAGLSLSREKILHDVWGFDPDTLTRTVDTHVASLRQKLEKDPKRPELILTVAGMGYKFAD